MKKYETRLSEDSKEFVRKFLLVNSDNKTLAKILRKMEGDVLSLSNYEFQCFKKVLSWSSGKDYYKNLKMIFGTHLEKWN